jgi:hypothetical protein
MVAAMRRPRHGATSHPPLTRPGNGFGRPMRPGPRARVTIPSDDELRRVLAHWSVDVDLVRAERGEA